VARKRADGVPVVVVAVVVVVVVAAAVVVLASEDPSATGGATSCAELLRLLFPSAFSAEKERLLPLSPFLSAPSG
jgi:hypothetical protein